MTTFFCKMHAFKKIAKTAKTAKKIVAIKTATSLFFSTHMETQSTR